LDNRFTNAGDTLLGEQAVNVDPVMRAKNSQGLKNGIDEVEQQAAEGRIHEHNAKGELVTDSSGAPVPYSPGKGGVVSAYMPVRQALTNLWTDEVMPLLSKATDWGATASLDDVAGSIKNMADEYGGKLGETLRSRAKEYVGKEMTPLELQGRITALNDMAYGKGATLPITDNIQLRAIKREAAMLNELLSKTVDPLFAEVGPTATLLKERWGGTRKLLDGIMEGTELKLRKGKSAENPTIGQAAAAAGASTSGTVGRITGYNKAKGMLEQWKNNPDTALETLVRVRRAQGGAPPRQLYKGESPASPRQVYDPSTGAKINAEGQGNLGPTSLMTQPGPVVQTTQGPTSPMTQPGPVVQRTQGPTSPMTQPGPVVQRTQGPSTIGGGNPSQTSLADLGIPNVPQKIRLKQAKDTVEAIKDEMKASGKTGKAAVVDIAKQLGMPVAVLATILLTKDKNKQMQLLQQYGGGGI
jgi:hypothetical protein